MNCKDVKPTVGEDLHHSFGKHMLFYVGWDGDDGCISIDKLLTLINEHYPNTSLSSLAITIYQECEIVIFNKDLQEKE